MSANYLSAFKKVFYETLTRIQPVKKTLFANQRCPPFRVSVNWREYCICKFSAKYQGKNYFVLPQAFSTLDYFTSNGTSACLENQKYFYTSLVFSCFLWWISFVWLINLFLNVVWANPKYTLRSSLALFSLTVLNIRCGVRPWFWSGHFSFAWFIYLGNKRFV